MRAQPLLINKPTFRAIRQEYYKRDFYEFRKWIAPMKGQKFVDGWWQRKIAEELEQFYRDLKAGLRPKLLIKSPPQHGKSQQIIDVILWFIIKEPSYRNIFASYSDRLGVRANLTIQRVMSHPDWQDTFPDLCLGAKETKNTGDISRPARNREHIEFWPHGGSFRNTTIQGKITGESLDVGFIDDVIKGREDANSLNTRTKSWEWFTDDFFSRFSEHAGFICIGTNWHVDDPMQRMIEAFKDLKVVSYPAIAIVNEAYRSKGEALFPELKSLAFILERKALMTAGNFSALYQQDPQIAGGDKFKDTTFDFVEMPSEFDWEFIIVDTAYTKGKDSDYTVAGHFGMKDMKLYLNDMWREQIEAADVEIPLTAFIKKHEKFELRKVLIEPKGHGIYLNQQLRKKSLGIPDHETLMTFFKDRRLDKVERANNAIPHLSDKKLHINMNLKDKDDIQSELLQFPNGKHDDIVDVIIDGIKEAYGSEVTIFDLIAGER